jgi:hypothetical protein
MWLYIIVPSAAVGALLILLLIVLCVRRSKRKRHSKGPSVIKGSYPGTNGRLPGGAQQHPHPQQQQMEMNALLPPSSLSPHSQGSSGVGLVSAASANNCNRIPVLAPEYPLHAVRFQQDLGEGAFGKVSPAANLNFIKTLNRQINLNFVLCSGLQGRTVSAQQRGQRVDSPQFHERSFDEPQRRRHSHRHQDVESQRLAKDAARFPA